MSNVTRKAVNFDYSTKILEENLENLQMGGTYRQAYKDIEGYFEECGLKHTQGSGYTSDKPISYKKMFGMISKISEEFPYMEGAFKSVEVTSVNAVYDVTNLVRENHSLEILEDKNLKKLEKDYGIKKDDSRIYEKSIRFDFSGEILRKKFQEYGIDSDIESAYKVVGNYLKNLGYSHEQGSVYLSTIKKNDSDVLKDVLKFSEECPYLAEAFSSVQISSVRGKYDVTNLANYGNEIRHKEEDNLHKQMELKIDKDNTVSI